MNNNFIKIKLDFGSSKKYFQKRLQVINIGTLLEKYLNEYLNFDNGVFYTYMLKSIITEKADVINKFDQGILGWQKYIKLDRKKTYKAKDFYSYIAEDVYLAIKNSKNVFLAADPYGNLKNSEINLPTFKLNNVSFYILSRTDSKQKIEQFIDELNYYPGVLGVVLEKNSSELNENIINELKDAKKIKKIYLQAYDNEGYIIWKKINGSVKAPLEVRKINI